MTKDNHLAVPHISVKDIRWIDWVELEKRGFKGVVFDKDNTLTLPYSLALWPPLESSLDSCKSVFGDNVAVFSNSAGLSQYDANGSKARTPSNQLEFMSLDTVTSLWIGSIGLKEGLASVIDNPSSSFLTSIGDRRMLR
ncbi:hypothetical protein IFM89_034217 [Coptis chinensis]|uniref:Uncharacterized protein n=1 Tax=Coptis chinensis TaxID=261450 RepID=A0A835LH65_9MAGN|nr:hypothetical protein IFM89_034217 [Coptis chinensis]